MGDLSTHQAIFKTIVRPVLKELGCDDPLIAVFELGNWLRDVSQFRDPYAFAVKKTELFKQKWFRGLTPGLISRRLELVFGPSSFDSGPVVSGALGEWFRSVIRAVGVLQFSKLQIAESDFARLFDANYTQYFPHEHLDFPPESGGVSEWTRRSTFLQSTESGPRRVLAYLDDYISYVAGAFQRAEHELRSLFWTPQLARTPQWRRDVEAVILNLGKASHALEDFYFHSNFCELAVLRSERPKTDPVDLATFRRIGRIQKLTERQRRRFFRRTRAVGPAEGRSEPARLIFTGGFGGSDVMYTFADALEGVAQGFDEGVTGKKQVEEIEGLGIVLFKYLLLPEHRRKLVRKSKSGVRSVDEKELIRVTDEHLKQVRAKKITPDLSRGAQLTTEFSWGMAMSVRTFKESFEHALFVDASTAQQTEVNTGLNAVDKPMLVCIGAILLTLAAQMEIAEQEMEERSVTMDSSAKDEYYLGNENLSSLENVACHSLMSKDSIRKVPLRAETDLFARFAVKTTMTTLGRQILDRPRDKYVDWHNFIRRLMCHPAQAPYDWASNFVQSVAVDDRAWVPPTLSERDSWRSMMSSAEQIRELEESYRRLYEQAERAWKKETG